MTTHELIAGKAVALVTGAASGATVALASATASVPLEWTGILALVAAAVGYGRLSGQLQERQASDRKTDRRMTQSIAYLEACVTRVAEKLNVPLSDLQAQFQTHED
jgi:NAD(P)-dependent dehydrogenase (short-subunit alcohol dehydrogenase family)